MIDYTGLTRQFRDWGKRCLLKFPRLNYRWVLSRLNAKERQLMAKINADFEEATKIPKSRDELQKLEATLMNPVWDLRNERRILESRYLLATMNRLGLPYPAFGRSGNVG
jgi:hypothetical protein